MNTTVGSPGWFTTSSSTAAGLSDGPEFICFLSRSSAVSSSSSGGLAARRATMSARLGNLKVLPVAVEAMGNYKEGYDSTAMVLYDYFRSSAAYRVRIALNLKGLAATHRSIHLRKGEQRAAVYLEVNPQGLVPTLVVDGTSLTQSLAIIEYLEEKHPSPALLPKDAADRAWVRAIALAIACDIHPLNNLRVLKYLDRELQARGARHGRFLLRRLPHGGRHLPRAAGGQRGAREVANGALPAHPRGERHLPGAPRLRPRPSRGPSRRRIGWNQKGRSRQ